MAYLLSSERPAVAATRTNLVSAVFGWIADVRAARARRRALNDLLEFDGALLDDIGLNRQDIVDAMHVSRPGQRLSQRRAEAARNWLNP